MTGPSRELLESLEWMVSFEIAAIDSARVRTTEVQSERIDEMTRAMVPPRSSSDPRAEREQARLLQRRFGPIAIDCVRQVESAVAKEQRRLAPLAAAIDLLIGGQNGPDLTGRLEASLQSHAVLAGAPQGDDGERMHREVGGWEVCLGSLTTAERALSPDGEAPLDVTRAATITRRIRLAFNDVLEPIDQYFDELEEKETP